jgi:hypothetical protein
VQIRVGLNSGAVVVRSIGNDLHMDYTAVGQTTHLAARMEQLARPGTTLLTGNILRLAEGYVEVKTLGPVPVKGLQEPIEIYKLLRAGPVRSRLQSAVARGLTRFIGRNTELEQLHQALARAGAGHGQVVAVVGEPGVGKSRLVYEFTHSHRTHGWLLRESHSVSYGKATPYLPFIDLLKAYFGIEARDDARKMREKVTGKLLALDRAMESTLPAFLTLLEVPVEDLPWQALEPQQRRQRILEAIKRLLLRESQAQPLLLVFEDLHWIDAETQALLDSLMESLPTAQLLLLVNYRPEYQHGWGSKTYYTQLRLDPLPPENTEALLQGFLGEDASLAPLKGLLIERTQGNPFFLEETVRTLVQMQALAGERGTYRLAQALPSIQVPATVQAMLAARIDRLPPEEKRVLQIAAVIGTEVPWAMPMPCPGRSPRPSSYWSRLSSGRRPKAGPPVFHSGSPDWAKPICSTAAWTMPAGLPGKPLPWPVSTWNTDPKPGPSGSSVRSPRIAIPRTSTRPTRTTSRPLPWPESWACARSWPTATSASACSISK